MTSGVSFLIGAFNETLPDVLHVFTVACVPQSSDRSSAHCQSVWQLRVLTGVAAMEVRPLAQNAGSH